MRTKTRDAARQTPAARRSTKQPPLKRRRAASDAPAAGTAEDPIKADSSSEYDDESDGEFLEPEPVPRKRGRSSADDAPPKERKTTKSEAYDSKGIVYAWDKLDLDIKQYEREALDALDQKTAALCREPRGGATYVLLTDEGPIPVCAPPEYLEALYSISDKIGRDVEVKVQGPCQIKFDDIYQNAQFNETNEKDGGQFSPHILLRETRAYPHEKGECDK